MELGFDQKKNITNSDKTIMWFKKVSSKTNDLIVVRGIVKNWPDVLLFRLGFKEANFVMELRNGLKINISKPKDYFRFWDTEGAQRALLKQWGLDKKIKIKKNKKMIRFNFMHKSISLVYDSGKQIANTIRMIKDQFMEEQYCWLDVRGKDVVDIGANIGDTAIYFALKSAKHVYAFEPYPYSYGLALKNIKLNELQDKITLLNEGCGGKETRIKIDSNYQSTANTDLKKFIKGKEIRITTLGDLLKRFKITYPTILKIDCEGCEYAVLLKASNDVLKKFEQIQIEYHHGYLNLKKKLEDAGFRVVAKFPEYGINQEVENKEMLMGFIYAQKQN